MIEVQIIMLLLQIIITVVLTYNAPKGYKWIILLPFIAAILIQILIILLMLA